MLTLVYYSCKTKHFIELLYNSNHDVGLNQHPLTFCNIPNI